MILNAIIFLKLKFILSLSLFTFSLSHSLKEIECVSLTKNNIKG